MKSRFFPLFAVLAGLAAPASANAALTEIAPLGTASAGCPGFAEQDCAVVLARQTAFQAKVGTTKAFTTVKSSGHVVAWTVSLVSVSAEGVKNVNSRYGGAPRAALVVLAPLGKSRYKVVEKGPLVDLTKYLGTNPTFALPTALPVKAGYVVGITVPTWAPMLQLGLGGDTSWRSSKPLKESVDKDYRPQRALVGTNAEASFGALYQRVRMAYSAVMVPTPTPAKTKK
ncbi:MAG: hypothetical protein JHD16_02765 [Solirubrobacteraceae bacterium]|nr:hypothetical protein [Solirubrobacteraceae bacterium]